MEVHLTPDLEAKLSRMASQCGRDAGELVSEAIERFVEYEGWFIREVEKGLAQVERGELLEHDEIVARIEKRLQDKRQSI